MLKHVTNIKEFGVFDDFRGADLPDFGRFNLIFGWNYSGKTTLSRVFQCLEFEELHEDYQNASFSILTAEGAHINVETAKDANVKVYNEDFRKRHLGWDEVDGFLPIVLLGEENIELWSELERFEETRLALEDRKKGLDDLIADRRKKIGDAETRCARQIVNSLPVGRFDRRGLVPIITSWKGELPEPLDTVAIEAAKVAVTAEIKNDIADWQVELQDFDVIYSEAEALIEVSLTSDMQIDHLVRNPDIAVWVEVGRELHDGKTQCEFCENVIPQGRLRDLDAHFSDAFVDLKRKISVSIESLKRLKIEPKGEAFLRTSYYKDQQPTFDNIKGRVDGVVAEFNNALDLMLAALDAKKDNPFRNPSIPSLRPQSSSVEVVAAELSELVRQTNERTSTFDARRSAAIDLLKKHFCAEEMRAIDRFEIEQKIEAEESALIEIAAEYRSALSEIGRIQQELSNAAKGAEAVNQTLVSFFGKNDIRLSVTENDRFLLMRGDEPAQNLSEGEKSAIAFCYFVTKLREDGNDLADTIVYIDDPISSLDANHLLHLAAFVRSTFYEFHDEHPKHRCLAKQLFISTHSHEFFHLIYDWFRKMKDGDFRTWMVQRRDTEARASATLIECPKSITEYRSEYLFLFKQLRQFIDAPADDASVIFNVGNMARRFIEGYCAFKFLERSNVDGSLSKIIADPVELERARKFMHFYSHTLSRGGGAVLPDMNEAVTIVRNLLAAIENHDAVHFASLETAA